MAIPYRGKTQAGETYFVTCNCFQRKRVLQSTRMAMLTVEVLLRFRLDGKYLLHEFVVMPDHFHALLTTVAGTSLEAAVSIIKGGISYRANREFGLRPPLWQSSFVDRRVRDAGEYQRIARYIADNPVKARLCETSQEWPYGSSAMKLDEPPQGLKPIYKQASSSQA
jgi:putative transposase